MQVERIQADVQKKGKEPKKIISSPYTEEGHLLDLDSLEPDYQTIAKAFQGFKPTTENYATESYIDSFNIKEIAGELSQAVGLLKVYIIVFRSILKKEIQQDPDKIKILFDADQGAHEEANLSGGLLKYWYGVPKEATGQNLATCLWRSRQDAKRGGNGKSHSTSVLRTKDWYAFWRVEQYELEFSSFGWKLRQL